VLPATAVAQSSRVGPTGAAATFTTPVLAVQPLVNGQGSVRLAAPSPTSVGSVAIALNLGTTTTDRACLPTRPSSTGASLPWLRSRWGVINGCNANRWDSDPSATASFGLSPGESRRRVYERQAF
jgi:MSHA biogenesis protein MshQ